MKLKTHLAMLAGSLGPLHGYKEMYLKEDVDTRIQDLEAKVLSLDSQLMVEKMHARNFIDQRNYAESENKKLLRSLWIARAKRALEKIAWFKLWNARIKRNPWIAKAKRAIGKIVRFKSRNACMSTMNPEDARQEYDKWKKVLGKCLAKAEEYK